MATTARKAGTAGPHRSPTANGPRFPVLEVTYHPHVAGALVGSTAEPGRNARRVLHGTLNAATGDLAVLARERSRHDDCLAFVEALGQVRPHVPKLLVSRQCAAAPSQTGAGRGGGGADHHRLAALPRQNCCPVKTFGDTPTR